MRTREIQAAMKRAAKALGDPFSRARGWCFAIAELQRANRPPHLTPAQFLLEHGELVQERHMTRVRGIPRACYWNAYRLARKRKGYRYVEGFASSDLMPVEHAWCLDREGYVIDPTWPLYKADYFGVAFNLDFVRRVRRMTGTTPVLWSFEHWRHVWPLVREEFNL